MARVQLNFIDCWHKDSVSSMFSTEMDGVKFIEIDFNTKGNSELTHVFNMDISTAIKFAKTLRTEINKAKEVYNEKTN